jgi:4'-phosphopantetheinyl transferase
VSDGRNGWDKPAELPRLRTGEVEIWRVDTRTVVHDCWRLLQRSEIERARRVRADVARDEFVAGRGTLRWLLAQELDCAARDVRLAAGEHGKLRVDGAGIEFSVAHSRGVVLIALSRVGVVGIDIEHADRTMEALDIARGSFHADEVARIERVQESERSAFFYRCWTRKEAVVKADGRGLMMPLNSFAVDLEDVAGESMVSLGGDSRDGEGCEGNQTAYYVRGLHAGDSLVAALHEFAGFGSLDREPTAWAVTAPGRRSTSGNSLILLPWYEVERNVGLRALVGSPSVE